MKKESLLEFREVYHATPSNSRKYPITKVNNNVGDIRNYVGYLEIESKRKEHAASVG
jgi:hypothetical protein